MGIKDSTAIFCLKTQGLVWGPKLWKMPLSSSKSSNKSGFLILWCIFFVLFFCVLIFESVHILNTHFIILSTLVLSLPLV